MFFLMPDAEELRTMLSIYTEYYEEGFSAFEDDKVHTIAALGVGYQAARTLHWLIDILESPSYEGATREEIAKDLRRSLEESTISELSSSSNSERMSLSCQR